VSTVVPARIGMEMLLLLLIMLYSHSYLHSVYTSHTLSVDQRGVDLVRKVGDESPKFRRGDHRNPQGMVEAGARWRSRQSYIH